MFVGLCIGMDVNQLVIDVQESCSSDTVSKGQVRSILEKASSGDLDSVVVDIEVGDEGYETIVSRLGVVVDIEVGDLQKEWEDHIVENEGFVIEDDGVVYGFDSSGDEL